MMYDELRGNLMAQATHFSVHDETSLMLLKAADAIEELSKYADAIRKLKCEGLYLQQSKYHDGYQAVSTMPLPQPPEDVET